MAIPEDNDPVRATIWPPVEIVALIMALHHGMVSNKFEKKKLKNFFFGGKSSGSCNTLLVLYSYTTTKKLCI